MNGYVGSGPYCYANSLSMVVGGALTYVLTNEAIQRAAIRGIMQVWLNVQGGIEETKERFRDAESEIKTGRHG